jgi:hypothetical protein
MQKAVASSAHDPKGENGYKKEPISQEESLLSQEPFHTLISYPLKKSLPPSSCTG